MKAFKYKVIKTTTELNETKLNGLGRGGLELTGVTTNEYGYTYYFKKEIQPGE